MSTNPNPLPQPGPSDAFVRRTRNPDLPQPSRVERTIKQPGDIVITTRRRMTIDAPEERA